MIASNVARRYAKAFFELGQESKTLESMVEEMSALGQAYESSADFRQSMENPLVALEAKRRILSEVCERLRVSPLTRNGLMLLADRRRLRILPGVAQELREMSDARKGVVRAEVTTAVRLSDGFYTRLQQQLEKMTGQRVALDRREDPSLIGGVVARIGDTVIDGSLRARLNEMRASLLAEPGA